MLKVLYVPSLNKGVVYWRIEAYAQQMVKLKEDVAVNVEYFRDIIDINVAWDDAAIGKGKISQKIQEKMKNAFKFFDVIIFQRIQNMPALAMINELRKEFPKTKIVAEIDDSVGEVSPSSPHKWGQHHRWSAEHLHMSDAVICSTQYLADSIGFIIGDKPVHVAPNCINKSMWKIKKCKDKHKHVRIGYVGGGAHDEDLLIAYRAMLPILEKDNKVKFVIRYGGFRPKFLLEHPQIDFKSVAWEMDQYPQELENMKLDLALAPLRDSEFNRCKSNLKWVEWSILNVPLLASPVEPYIKTSGVIYITKDNTVQEWKSSLKEIIGELKINLRLNNEDHKGFPLKRQCINNQNMFKETRNVLKFLNNLVSSD